MSQNKKEQKLLADWRKYNKDMQVSRVPPISLEEYKNCINSTSKKYKPNNQHREPTLSIPSWATSTNHIKSIQGGSYIPTKSMMVERALLGLETPDIANEIIRKSKRIGLMYSKGAYQYSNLDDPEVIRRLC
jgi:hypothetical protein